MYCNSSLTCFGTPVHVMHSGIIVSISACSGGMAVDMGDSAFEMSTNASSSNSECDLSSPSDDTTNVSHVASGSGEPSFHTSFNVREQSQHSGDEHDDISLCAGFGRDQWVGLDVVLLNDIGDPVADGM